MKGIKQKITEDIVYTLLFGRGYSIDNNGNKVGKVCAYEADAINAVKDEMVEDRMEKYYRENKKGIDIVVSRLLKTRTLKNS